MDERTEVGTARLARELVTPLEGIVNILYLIKHSREDPEQILRLVAMGDVHAAGLIEIVRRELK